MTLKNWQLQTIDIEVLLGLEKTGYDEING